MKKRINKKNKDISINKNPQLSDLILQYLKDLELRGLNAQTDRERQVEKLLSHAIRLEYSDNFDTYNKCNTNTQESCEDQAMSPLESIDRKTYLFTINFPCSIERNKKIFSDTSAEFLTGLSRVQVILQICSKASDSTSVLQAVADLIGTRLSASAIQASARVPETSNSIQLTLEDIDLGFKTKGLNE